MAIQDDMRFASECAREAGAIIRNMEREARESQTLKASIMDVATSADTAAEQAIFERIRAEYPDDSVVGEEGTSSQGKSGRRWVIDPLDGTANYVRGWNASAVSIGLSIDGEYAVGAIYDPYSDELFVAGTGEGAFKNGERLIRQQSLSFDESFVGVTGSYSVTSRRLRAEVTRRLILQAGDVRSLGSAALSFCYMADGRLDASFGNGYGEWDMAAGIVIAREAGCMVTGAKATDRPSAHVALIAIPSLTDSLASVVRNAESATKADDDE